MDQGETVTTLVDAFRTFEVDPGRLEPGRWNEAEHDWSGEGDIHGSYSADRIASDQPIRKPFTWQGGLWVTISSQGQGGLHTATAYRLVEPGALSGQPATYGQRCAEADLARCDPNGFYHGVTVRYAGRTLILSGPPAFFAPGQSEQMDLFGP